MAKANAVTIETERVVVQKEAGVQLSLNVKEAEVLLRIVGCIGGAGYGRDQTNAIYDALVGIVARNEQVKVAGYINLQ